MKNKTNKIVNKVGNRYGMIVVISHQGRKKKADGHYEQLWKCKCDCGKTFIRSGITLRENNKATQSCGCLTTKRITKTGVLTGKYNKGRLKKGEKVPPIYRNWVMMKQNCTNKNATFYKSYKKLGNEICEDWMDFTNFYNDMKDSYDKACKDNPKESVCIFLLPDEKVFNKENTLWVTRSYKANHRKNSARITHDNKTMTVTEWEEETGLPIRSRLNNGWSKDQLFLPRGERPKRFSKKELEFIKFFKKNKRYIKFLPVRSQEIVIARFGLNGGIITNNKIVGSDFNMSRERVRQLTIEAVNTINSKIK